MVPSKRLCVPWEELWGPDGNSRQQPALPLKTYRLAEFPLRLYVPRLTSSSTKVQTSPGKMSWNKENQYR